MTELWLQTLDVDFNGRRRRVLIVFVAARVRFDGNCQLAKSERGKEVLGSRLFDIVGKLASRPVGIGTRVVKPNDTSRCAAASTIAMP